MAARCVPHLAFPPQPGDGLATAATATAVRDMMVHLTNASGMPRSIAKRTSELAASNEKEQSAKRQSVVAQLSDAEKKARRREQNRVSAKRSYEKRAAMHAGVEQDVRALQKQLQQTSQQIAALASFMAELPPVAKIADAPEFAKLIIRADATPTLSSGSSVYCAFSGQELLGVFSNEDAAKQRVSGIENGVVQTQLIDQSSQVMDQSSRPSDAEGENKLSATSPGKQQLAATAAAVLVPTAAAVPVTRI